MSNKIIYDLDDEKKVEKVDFYCSFSPFKTSAFSNVLLFNFKTEKGAIYPQSARPEQARMVLHCYWLHS